MITREVYESAFATESARPYPSIDAVERAAGYALAPERYLPAARVLACPVKVNPPNWQHGRVIYALTRQYLEGQTEPVQLLDIGTAKGYSALCLRWALEDSGRHGRVTSVDVIDPHARVKRNTIADVGGVKTLSEILAPWPEAQTIDFLHCMGQKWLTEHPVRVHVAFVDGKHTYEAVTWEAALLAERQQAGDLAIFDDVQIPAVARAIESLSAYRVEYIDVLPNRRYAVGRRA
jgi:predicted O-methyltransferase YrrM